MPKAKLKRRIRTRNLHASAPIMRKGGVHEKSTKAKRAASKRVLRAELRRGVTS